MRESENHLYHIPFSDSIASLRLMKLRRVQKVLFCSRTTLRGGRDRLAKKSGVFPVHLSGADLVALLVAGSAPAAMLQTDAVFFGEHLLNRLPFIYLRINSSGGSGIRRHGHHRAD